MSKVQSAKRKEQDSNKIRGFNSLHPGFRQNGQKFAAEDAGRAKESDFWISPFCFQQLISEKSAIFQFFRTTGEHAEQ
jgi:hypothetical protein